MFEANSNSVSNLKCTENQLNKRVLADTDWDGTARKHTEKCWSVKEGEGGTFTFYKTSVKCQISQTKTRIS